MFGDELAEAARYADLMGTIAPGDREDIYALSTTLVDIIDFIEGLASAVVRYGVQEYPPFMRQFAGVIQRMILELKLLAPVIEGPRDIRIIC